MIEINCILAYAVLLTAISTEYSTVHCWCCWCCWCCSESKSYFRYLHQDNFLYLDHLTCLDKQSHLTSLLSTLTLPSILPPQTSPTLYTRLALSQCTAALEQRILLLSPQVCHHHTVYYTLRNTVMNTTKDTVNETFNNIVMRTLKNTIKILSETLLM